MSELFSSVRSQFSDWDLLKDSEEAQKQSHEKNFPYKNSNGLSQRKTTIVNSFTAHTFDSAGTFDIEKINSNRRETQLALKKQESIWTISNLSKKAIGLYEGIKEMIFPTSHTVYQKVCNMFSNFVFPILNLYICVNSFSFALQVNGPNINMKCVQYISITSIIADIIKHSLIGRKNFMTDAKFSTFIAFEAITKASALSMMIGIYSDFIPCEKIYAMINYKKFEGV
ncbi:hypothetical protein EDEG_02584 [Edhazardia aedis USNM 41457]|uniref:Uncharacterized protein n=1 Tax=Edhazardia aedis (strain USNM 41457) TaxID=1003232 RepID=J9D667_EDHAE|nr:hypothetical protein EDEG_02584 [Edhazardia aedis USNM 41457]|eukprot:EJW03034.1 hypothetical protein EDEG_02584 [Edhazardia aedis USNM 41457]